MSSRRRKRNTKKGNFIKVENALHQSRKCKFKIENVIKVETATSMCITQCKKKIKNNKVQRMKFNSRQLIQHLKMEIAALK